MLTRFKDWDWDQITSFPWSLLKRIRWWIVRIWFFKFLEVFSFWDPTEATFSTWVLSSGILCISWAESLLKNTVYGRRYPFCKPGLRLDTMSDIFFQQNMLIMLWSYHDHGIKIGFHSMFIVWIMVNILWSYYESWSSCRFHGMILIMISPWSYYDHTMIIPWRSWWVY